MVIGRKPKKTGMRIKDEPVEQVDSFKYLGCNISSNMNCCEEVKQRIAMAKEAFIRKSSISRRSLEKEQRKRLAKCFVWSVALYGVEHGCARVAHCVTARWRNFSQYCRPLRHYAV